MRVRDFHNDREQAGDQPVEPDHGSEAVGRSTLPHEEDAEAPAWEEHADQAEGAGGAPQNLSNEQLDAALEPQGAGRPLEPRLRKELERSTGYRLNQVRVHVGGSQGELLRAHGKRGVAKGRHIMFPAGEYRPTDAAGKALIRHEVNHVIQQANGQVSSRLGRAERARHEADADRTTDHKATRLKDLSPPETGPAQFWGRWRRKIRRFRRPAPRRRAAPRRIFNRTFPVFRRPAPRRRYVAPRRRYVAPRRRYVAPRRRAAPRRNIFNRTFPAFGRRRATRRRAAPRRRATPRRNIFNRTFPAFGRKRSTRRRAAPRRNNIFNRTFPVFDRKRAKRRRAAPRRNIFDRTFPAFGRRNARRGRTLTPPSRAGLRRLNKLLPGFNLKSRWNESSRRGARLNEQLRRGRKKRLTPRERKDLKSYDRVSGQIRANQRRNQRRRDKEKKNDKGWLHRRFDNSVKVVKKLGQVRLDLAKKAFILGQKYTPGSPYEYYETYQDYVKLYKHVKKGNWGQVAIALGIELVGKKGGRIGKKLARKLTEKVEQGLTRARRRKPAKRPNQPRTAAERRKRDAERRRVEARRLRRKKRFQRYTDHAGERAGEDLTKTGAERVTGTDDNED